MAETAGHTAQLKAIAAMIAGAALLSLNDAVSKYLTESYPVGQIIALRQMCSFLVLIPYVHWVSGWPALKMTNRRGQLVRGFFTVTTMGLIVLSLSLLPLATVISIAFSSPIIVVALSAAFLGETVGHRRWFAVLLGFAGVLVIIRPGGASFHYLLMIPFLTAISAALRDTLTRPLSRTEPSISILFWSSVMVVAAASTTALWGWKPVSPADAGWLLLNGILSAGAHFLMIEALRLGDASLVAPFRYTGLLWALLLGFLIWGQWPDAWTLTGAAILVASGVYIIERESKR